MKLNLLLPIVMGHLNAILAFKETANPKLQIQVTALQADHALRTIFWLPSGNSFLSFSYAELLGFIPPDADGQDIICAIMNKYNAIRKQNPDVGFQAHIIEKTAGKLDVDFMKLDFHKVGPIVQRIKDGKLLTTLELTFGVNQFWWVANYALIQKPYDYARFFIKKKKGKRRLFPITQGRLSKFIKKELGKRPNKPNRYDEKRQHPAQGRAIAKSNR